MDINKTLDERNTTHGDFHTVAATVQTLKRILHRTPNWDKLQPGQQEALEMDAAKTARILCGNPNEVDHWHDKAGYAMLGARACTPLGTLRFGAAELAEPAKFLTNTRENKPAVPFSLPAKKEEPPKSA